YTSGANLGGYNLAVVFYYGGDSAIGGANHDHGPNIVVLDWSPGSSADPSTHLYVYFRFDVAPNTPVGSVANITSVHPFMHSGGITGILEPGSVTIS
ncbi:MAG: hypothetical protein FWD05_11295, partial [Oscillospiraceae bacterium]|nr:hypothetical protein [Oscillospiraceae bacterium]